jgi:putative membrane protein insertion efficiency factor
LLLNKLAKAFILFYQSTFSYFLGGNCRFYPTCSHYASEAFSKHNFMKAFGLTVSRLLSCHPFTKRSVFDPVPLPAHVKASPLAQEKKEIV